MKIEEAKKLIMSKYPDREIYKITETANYFLIAIRRKNKSKNSTIMPILYDDGLKAVDKKTKDVFTYNPIRDGE